MIRVVRGLIVIGVWLLAAHCALAAVILVEASTDGQPTVVRVEGELGPDDGNLFRMKIGMLSQAIIAFRSDGGSVIAGIDIGETIRLKDFATLVQDNARCASACALAWLGGTQRFMGKGAKIGFHAAYNAESGQETGVGNALVGAYLNRIGLPYSAIIYITRAAPNSMTWLSVVDAIKHGISVTPLTAGRPPPPAESTAKAELPPRGLTSDEVAMILATMVVADERCGMKTNGVPLNIEVAKLGQDLVDFEPDNRYAPLVEIKIKKAHEFISQVGEQHACNGMQAVLLRFLPNIYK